MIEEDKGFPMYHSTLAETTAIQRYKDKAISL
jgi:hypothetical protein